MSPRHGSATVACWVDYGPAEAPTAGDIVRIGAERASGVLGMTLLRANVTSHQSNLRNASFWLQWAAPGAWKDCGRLGNADSVRSMAVHRGSLYAGTYEQEPTGAGRVMRLAPDGTWEDCGLPDNANAVAALAVHHGSLYAASARFHGRGTAMAQSGNDHAGGRVHRMLDGDRWVSSGVVPDEDGVGCLAVVGDRLYATPSRGQGLYLLHEPDTWEHIEGPGRRVLALAAIDETVVATGNEGGGIVPWLGDAGGGVFRLTPDHRWASLGLLPGTTQVYSAAQFRGDLYVSTWPGGVVYRRQGDAWVSCGQLGSDIEAMGMIVYNGSLFAAGLPSAGLYRYEGGTAWTFMGSVCRTRGLRYRRAWGLAVFGGRLYAGSTPGGRVYALQDGLNATHDVDPGPGWHHLAGVFDGSTVALHLDGSLVARSRRSMTETEDPRIPSLSDDVVIAAPPGRVRDLRVIPEALDDDAIHRLAARSPGGAAA